MYKDAANQVLDNLNSFAEINFDATKNCLIMEGSWIWSTINENKIFLPLEQIKNSLSIELDGSRIQELDTTGAYFIKKIINYLQEHKTKVSTVILPKHEKDLYERVLGNLDLSYLPDQHIESHGLFGNVGKWVIDFWSDLFKLIAFYGQFCINFLQLFRNFSSLNIQEMMRSIEDAGLRGLWVSSLLCFLIGITLAYEMSPQFVTYGANIYVVNFLGIALLKEVSPLLTAIIIAGRTGASITAEIGTMKVQEEIDAIQTMGISPIKRFVLPKIVGVMIAAPLITAIADIASMAGGAIVAKNSLGISYLLFFSRLKSYVSINNYTCGIVKSIAFGFTIALIGCFCGFNVKGDANSIGEQTTKSVVLGIIFVVLLDALFAVIFQILGV